ncbi:MAG: PilZ domain-containing protein [Armatimonadetes bacterium]|nr:PilZ domain-containing protein [Armatimonadota bacterium]
MECDGPDAPREASVINMGLGGLLLLSERLLPAGALLEIRQKDAQRGPVQVEVIWSRPRPESNRFECGGKYRGSSEQLERSWIKPALQRLGFEAPDMYERRRFRRVRLQLEARLRLGEVAHECLVLDLGLGGALVESRDSVRADEGQPVVLSIAVDGEPNLAGHLVYSVAGSRRFGLCFAEDAANRREIRLVEGYLQARS